MLSFTDRFTNRNITNTANYGIAVINQKENRTAETFGALNRENVNFSVTNPFSRDYFLASQNVSFKGAASVFANVIFFL